MAELTSAAAEAAALPDPSAIERAEAFTREPFLHDGEDAAVALAPASARRRALDAALAEIEAGAKVPSTRWRRRYALLLGLERLLSQDEPRLADGTTLNPHQVDALSGTLTALLAAAQNGHEAADDGEAPAPVLAVEDDEPAVREQVAHLFGPALPHERVEVAADDERRRLDPRELVLGPVLERVEAGPEEADHSEFEVVPDEDREERGPLARNVAQ